MADDGIASRPSLRQLRANLPDNVVILPTAAPRQVQQPQNRAGRLARQVMREQAGGRFNFKFPTMREAERRAAIMRSAGKDPGLILAHAILAEMDRDFRAKVIHRLARSSGNETARAALEFAQTTLLTLGEHLDLSRAFEELSQ